MVRIVFTTSLLTAAMAAVPASRRSALPPSRPPASVAPARHPALAPCLRPKSAGTNVQGAVKICPGRYRIPDPREKGVLVIAASGTTLDLTGVTLESGDSIPSRFVGVGVASNGVDAVTVLGGAIHGYRYGIRLDGGRDHRVRDTDVSRSRAQALRSTPERFDDGDWLDLFHPDVFEGYGGGLYLRRTTGVSVTGVTATGAQNGIGLFETRAAFISDNNVTGNSGWGIHLWRSTGNAIVRNRASRNVRCESARYRRGCDSAALLLRQRSDSNTIADNDLTYSGDGFFLSGHRPDLEPSVGNLVVRNDASHSWHNAFEATFSWNNTFIDNVADSSDYGFWLGYSSGSSVIGNTIIGARTAGIAIEHGSDNLLSGNIMIGAPIGLRLFAPAPDGPQSRGYRVDDNVFARLARAVALERTSQARLRGNLFDGVEDGIVADTHSTAVELAGNVFLRATGFFVRAPVLDAGGNFWGTATAAEARERVHGKINVEPWRPAREAGY